MPTKPKPRRRNPVRPNDPSATRGPASFASLSKSGLLPLLICDRKTLAVLDVNEAAADKYGYSRLEFLRLTLKDILPKDEVSRLTALTKRRPVPVRPSGEWRHRLKDGRLIDVHTTSQSLKFDGHNAISIVVRDITERQRAPESPHYSEDQYRGLVAEIGEGIFVADQRAVLTSASPALANILGVTDPGQLVGRSFFEFVSPAMRQQVAGYYRAAIRSGRTRDHTVVEIVRADGSAATVEVRSVPVLRDGKIVGTRGLVRDVTEAKRVADALAAADRRFRALIEKASDAIALLGPDGSLLYDSPAAPGLTGYLPGSLIGKSMLQLVHPDDVAQVSEILARLLREPDVTITTLFRFRHHDGRWLWFEASGTNMLSEPSVNALVLNYRDVTARVQSEHDAGERMKELRTLYALSSLAERPSLTLDDLYLKSVDLIPPGWQYPESTCARLIIGGREFRTPNFAVSDWTQSAPVKVDGEMVGSLEVGYLGRPPIGAEGPFLPEEQLLLDALARRIGDTTQRLNVAQELASAERRFRALVENAPDAIVSIAPDGRVLYDSPAAARLLGYEQGALRGQSAFELLHPEDHERVGSLLEQLVREPASPVTTMFRFRHKDGSWRLLEAAATNQLADPGVQAVVINYRDVTQREQAEQALVQRARELQTLYETSLEVTAQTTLDDLLKTIMERAATIVGTDMGSIYLLGADRQSITLVLAHNMPPSFVGSTLKLGEGISGVVAQTGVPMQVEDYQSWPRRSAAFDAATIRRVLAIPLKADSELIGVLNVADSLHPGSFSDDQVRLVGLLGNQAALAIRRQRAESALSDSEERYRNLVEHSPDAIAVHQAGRFVYANPAAARLIGAHDPRELIGKPILEVVHPDHRDRVIQRVGDVIAGQAAPVIEEKFIKLDGTPIDVDVTASPSIHEGRPAVQVIVRDITERKQAAREISSLAKFPLENPMPILRVDADGILLYANPASAGLLDAWGSSVGEAVPADWRDHATRAFNSGKPAEADFKVGARSFVVVATPIVEHGYVNLYGRDVTDRRLAEDALRASEARLKGLFEDSPVALWEQDFSLVKQRLDSLREDGIQDIAGYLEAHPEIVKECADLVTVLDVNKATLAVYGAHRKEDLLGGLGQVLDGVALDDFRSELVRIAAGDTRMSWEGVNRTLDGRLINIVLDWSAAPGYEQSLSRVVVAATDVTARTQAQALSDAVYRIAAAAENAPSLHELYRKIHQTIAAVMPAENFYITIYDAEHDILSFPYYVDVADALEPEGVRPARGLTAYVLRTGKSLLCTEAIHEELERQGEVELVGSPSVIWLGVPLIVDGATIGAMVVQHYTDLKGYGEREQHMLEFVSTQIATAIRRKQSEAALQAQLHELQRWNALTLQREGRILELKREINDLLAGVGTEPRYPSASPESLQVP